eukprot:980901_1
MAKLFACSKIRYAQHLEERKVVQQALKKARQDNMRSAIKHLLAQGGMYSTLKFIATFLYSNETLDKVQVGDFISALETSALSEQQHRDLLLVYCGLLNFTGQSFDTAFRHFLIDGGFNLPKEALKIDRLMGAFADAFVRDNPHVFATTDQTLVLSYGALILNTELHNSGARAAAMAADGLMTKSGFAYLVQSGETEVDIDMIGELYDSIKENPLEMKTFHQYENNMKDVHQPVDFNTSPNLNSTTDEEEIKIADYNDETKGNVVFFLLNECSQADPPIVLLHASHTGSIARPQLRSDLQFELESSEHAFTLLCSNLEECKHPHSEEWKLLQKNSSELFPVSMPLWDVYNFKQLTREVRRQNAHRGALHPDSVEKQKIKLRLILKLCGGYKRYGKNREKVISIRDENKRSQLVDDLYEHHKDYALTFDNILKIIAIFLRVKSGIPVLIMGESGCGKTRLLEYMANVLQLEMFSVDVHGGYNIHDLTRDINEAAEKALTNKQQTILLFFDEINTSEEIASFKEIICDHCFKGEQLPENLGVIGALNPYRRR